MNNRYLISLAKEKSDSWQTLGSTTSSISLQNSKNPSLGSVDTSSTEKQATEAINAFNEPSGIGVTTHSEDLAYLLDGNRAYLDSTKPIKAEYSDGSEDW